MARTDNANTGDATAATDDTTTAATPAAPTAPVAATDSTQSGTDNDTSQYGRDEIIELSQGMFGEAGHVVAGAMSLLDADRGEFTRDEVANAITRFKNHKVEIDTPEAH